MEGKGNDVGLSNADRELLAGWRQKAPTCISDDRELWALVLIGRLQRALSHFFRRDDLVCDGRWGPQSEYVYSEALQNCQWIYQENNELRAEVEALVTELRRIRKDPFYTRLTVST